jgi:hypothetical protein
MQYDANGNKLYRGGQMKNLRHGFGTEYKNMLADVKDVNSLTNYAFYKGEWHRGFKHGKGEFTVWDGKKGEFWNLQECFIDKDEISKGKCAVNDEQFGPCWYIGGFNELFQQHGDGVLLCEADNTLMFDGKFKAGLKNGKGKYLVSRQKSVLESQTDLSLQNLNQKSSIISMGLKYREDIFTNGLSNKEITTKKQLFECNGKDGQKMPKDNGGCYGDGGCNIF